jgi:AcrR family transcriptional regulator
MDTLMDKAPARWKRRKNARPAEILDAALQVFAEKGFAAARMEDIAARAGVTKGTIYLYFENKDAVFKALTQSTIGLAIGNVTDVAANFPGTTPDLLRFALKTMGGFLTTTDRVVLPKIILAESGNFPELTKFYRDNLVSKGLGLLSSIVSRGIARGEFRPMNPDHAARLCVSPILFIALWRTTFEQFDPEPYDYECYVDAHIDNLLRGFAAERDAS